MVAAYYLCRREDMESGAAHIIARTADGIRSGTPLFAPFPQESPDPALLTDIARALAASTDRLRQAGHNVIFPSLALKAVAEVPEAVTPSRVAGICRLIEAFTASDEPVAEGEVGVPACEGLRALAESALEEALAAMERFDGRGQGWTGHLLTHARAVVDLHLSGHADAARHARQGLALYIRRIRIGPGDGDRHIPEHLPADTTPLTQRYWQARQASDIGLGHWFKYPYAFYGLLDLAGDQHLKARCLEEAYRIF
jgi:hypothetical protein